MSNGERRYLRKKFPSVAYIPNKKFKARQKIQGAVLRHLGKNDIGPLRYSRTPISTMTTEAIRRQMINTFNTTNRSQIQFVNHSLNFFGGIEWYMKKLSRSELEDVLKSVIRLYPQGFTKSLIHSQHGIKPFLKKLNRSELTRLANTHFG